MSALHRPCDHATSFGVILGLSQISAGRGGIVRDDVEQAVAQFGRLFGQMSERGAPPSPLTVNSIKTVLSNNPDPASKTRALAEHIAFNSPLTIDLARSVAATAVDTSGGDDQAAASNASSALGGLAGSVQLKLSKPIPLAMWVRIVFSFCMAGALAAALVLIAIAHSTGTAEYVALGVLGGLGWLGSVVLVMGYQTVTITGSSGAPSAKQTT